MSWAPQLPSSGGRRTKAKQPGLAIGKLWEMGPLKSAGRAVQRSQWRGHGQGSLHPTTEMAQSN